MEGDLRAQLAELCQDFSGALVKVEVRNLTEVGLTLEEALDTPRGLGEVFHLKGLGRPNFPVGSVVRIVVYLSLSRMQQDGYPLGLTGDISTDTVKISFSPVPKVPELPAGVCYRFAAAADRILQEEGTLRELIPFTLFCGGWGSEVYSTGVGLAKGFISQAIRELTALEKTPPYPRAAHTYMAVWARKLLGEGSLLVFGASPHDAVITRLASLDNKLFAAAAATTGGGAAGGSGSGSGGGGSSGSGGGGSGSGGGSSSRDRRGGAAGESKMQRELLKLLKQRQIGQAAGHGQGQGGGQGSSSHQGRAGGGSSGGYTLALRDAPASERQERAPWCAMPANAGKTIKEGVCAWGGPAQGGLAGHKGHSSAEDCNWRSGHFLRPGSAGGWWSSGAGAGKRCPKQGESFAGVNPSAAAAGGGAGEQ